MEQQISLPYSLHSYKTLPLKDYLDCITGEDYTGLIIHGTADIEILKNHFKELSIYYVDLANSDSNKHYVSILKQRVRLQSRILQLTAHIKFYLLTKSDVVKKLMSKQGFYFESAISDELLIKKFEGFMINLNINLEHMDKDLEQFENESGGNIVTREVILRNIVEMGKHNYRVDLPTATAEFYFITAKAFAEFAEAQKAA